MRRMPCKYLLSLGFLLIAAALPAQESPGGRVSYIEDECILISGGRQRVYRSGDIGAEGLALSGGDMLQTGSGGRFELRLDPEGAVFKASENTFVQFKGFAGPEAAGPEAALLELLYGRLRITNDTEGEIRVKTGEGLVAFQRGDVSLDYISQAGGSSRPVLKIVVFAGEAELTPPGEDKTIKAEANEMITVASLTPFVLAERRILPRSRPFLPNRRRRHPRRRRFRRSAIPLRIILKLKKRPGRKPPVLFSAFFLSPPARCYRE